MTTRFRKLLKVQRILSENFWKCQNKLRRNIKRIHYLNKQWISLHYSTVTDEYDSDHFSGIDSNEQVGNVDTLVDDANLENKYDQVFILAPREGQHPLSLYHDVDAEYLCFPTFRPSKEERTIPVHYSAL